MSNPVGQQASYDINEAAEQSGRKIREDGVVVNLADAIGNVSVYTSIKGSSNRDTIVTTNGQLVVSNKDSQITEQFSIGLPSTGVDSDVTGSGSIVTEDSVLKLKTGTIDGSAWVESLQALRPIPGAMAYAFFSMAGLPVGASARNAFAGPFDDEDGFAIGVKDGVPNIFIRRWNGVSAETTYIPQSQWNGDKVDGTGPSGVTIDFTLGQFYSITFEYPFAGILFGIRNPDGSQILLHRINYPNTSQDPSILLPYLPIRAEVDNSGSGAAIELMVAAVDVGIFNGGKTDSASRFEGITTTALLATPKSTTGTDYIIALRGLDTYSGRKNKISALIKALAWDTQDSIKDVTLEFIKDPDVVTPGTWANINGSSTLEYSIDTVYDLTTGVSTGIGDSLSKDGSSGLTPVGELTNTLIRRSETIVAKISSTNGIVGNLFLTMQYLV